LRAQVDTLMGLGWVMVAVMLAFSVVLAAAILYNTATLGILERRREIATLRALGMTLREIAIGLTIEHLLIATAGLAIGVPLAFVAIRRVLGAFSSDLFSFPFVFSPVTIVVGAVGVLLVLLVAQWPALRQIARDSLAGAVRSREG
jgi:putative ABC transport system permease protein